jgi:hypothetical protein
VLVPERFSWGAAFFGVLWMLVHRAWIAAAFLLLLGLSIRLAPAPWQFWLGCALFLLQGAFAQDIRRWTLARRGYALAHVVSARNQDAALARLLDARPDLLEAAAR